MCMGCGSAYCFPKHPIFQGPQALHAGPWDPPVQQLSCHPSMPQNNSLNSICLPEGPLLLVDGELQKTAVETAPMNEKELGQWLWQSKPSRTPAVSRSPL